MTYAKTNYKSRRYLDIGVHSNFRHIDLQAFFAPEGSLMIAEFILDLSNRHALAATTISCRLGISLRYAVQFHGKISGRIQRPSSEVSFAFSRLLKTHVD